MKGKEEIFLFIVGYLLLFSQNAQLVEAESKIKHFVVVMLENRAFDHMLGHLKQINPEIDGLTGSESNPIDPSDPKSPQVKVSFDAPPDINMNPGHSVGATEIELWGSSNFVDPAPMNGFIKELLDTYSPGNASLVMRCYNRSTISVLSTLATEFAVFDKYYSSVPGPTFPNRMYFLTGTSYGSASNDLEPEIEGYPQRTFFDDLYDAGKSFKVYWSDFPTCTILSRIREYPLHFHTFDDFLDNAASGDLPAFSWVEPRWFNFLEWYENDQHPFVNSFWNNGNVYYGEFFLKEVYEALRASPQWNETALIITYDEHGGLYDHVSPPQKNVPNPDGMNSQDPEFKFDRLGLRIPHVVISPWIKKGSVYHEPAVNHYDHTSTIATVRKMLGMTSSPLTKREAWAATYEHIFGNDYRDDCPMTLPVASGTEERWKSYIKSQKTPETDENIKQMIARTPEFVTKSPPLTDLQNEIVKIAANVVPETKVGVTNINTLYEAGVFIRNQVKKFLKK